MVGVTSDGCGDYTAAIFTTLEYGSSTLTRDESGVACGSDHSFLPVLSAHPCGDRRGGRPRCGYRFTAGAAVKVHSRPPKPAETATGNRSSHMEGDHS
jgi:hypothetical protein